MLQNRICQAFPFHTVEVSPAFPPWVLSTMPPEYLILTQGNIFYNDSLFYQLFLFCLLSVSSRNTESSGKAGIFTCYHVLIQPVAQNSAWHEIGSHQTLRSLFHLIYCLCLFRIVLLYFAFTSAFNLSLVSCFRFRLLLQSTSKDIYFCN